MPLYDYQCERCGAVKEILAPHRDDKDRLHACGPQGNKVGRLRRVPGIPLTARQQDGLYSYKVNQP